MQTFSILEEHISQELVPDWVRFIAPNREIPIDPSQTNIQWLLVDRQENIELKTHYFHYIAKILDPLGVQELSNLFLSFDPLYEKIVFHDVFIIRYGQHIDKFQLDQVKILQREQRLESGIFDGIHQATLFLEDIRPGDVLEYAYSIIGANPLDLGKYASTFPLQYSTRVEYLHHRVLLKNQSIMVQHHPMHLEKYLIKNDCDWTWMLTPSPPCFFEPEQPAGSLSYGWVEVSEYSSWREVVQQLLPLYHLENQEHPELTLLVEQWIQESPSIESRVLKALRFVQNEIRYLSLEMGDCGMKPALPKDVFSQRSGDCKGKSQLLRYLLKQMGIRSSPCLVFTHDRSKVLKSLPRPNTFNHVIVYIELEEKMRFFDPTIMYQGGSFITTMCPNYGHGLILAEETTSLTPIPVLMPTKGIEVITSFDTFERQAEMAIHSYYYADEADQMRYRIKQQGILDLGRKYEQYYGALFGPIEVEPLRIQDDEEQNKIQIMEKCQILNFWTPVSKKQKQAFLYPTTLREYLRRSIDTNRKTSLALPHPIHITEKICIKGFQYKIKSKTIDHLAFSFSVYLNKKDEVTYQLVTKLDALEPEHLREYAQKLNDAWDSCQIALQQKQYKKRFQFEWWQIPLLVFFLSQLFKLIQR